MVLSFLLVQVKGFCRREKVCMVEGEVRKGPSGIKAFLSPLFPPPPPPLPLFPSSPSSHSDSLELLPSHFIVLYDISLKVHILCAPYECPTLHCWAQSQQVMLHVCLSCTPLHTSVYLCFVTPPPANHKRREHDDGHYEQPYGHQHGNEPRRLWEGQIS